MSLDSADDKVTDISIFLMENISVIREMAWRVRKMCGGSIDPEDITQQAIVEFIIRWPLVVEKYGDDDDRSRSSTA